jgi:methionyl-tRNA synthetase
VTALVHPVVPESSSRIWKQLGLGEIGKFRLDQLKWGQLELGTKLGKVEPVFPRVDKTAIEKMQELEQQGRPLVAAVEAKKPPATEGARQPVEMAMGQNGESSPPAGTGAIAGQPATQAAVSAPAAKPAPSAKAAAAVPEGKIAIDDFLKIELRVGLVKLAEKVKGADRLLRLEVDIGTEVRQLVAGIAEAYTPEQLIGRKVVIVANLAPRKLKGLESNGMIVAASVEGGKPVLAGFLEDVPVGAKLK